MSPAGEPPNPGGAPPHDPMQGDSRTSYPRVSDTIVAVSSATGVAARMIVRLSGPSAWTFAVKLSPGFEILPATTCSANLRFRNLCVPVQVYSFQSPHSYTAEDLVEFHLPGNPLLAMLLVGELIAMGARAAEPGEFTGRAYFHGRLDLTETEGVAATIAALNEKELRAARQLLSGELARRLRPLTDRIARTLALVEVGIDFVEEDVSFLSADEVRAELREVDQKLDELLKGSARFENVTREPTAVLMGRPNAGKSTLLNTLARTNRAIVSEIAGTTRDAVSARIQLESGVLRLIDVAGIHEPTPEPDEHLPPNAPFPMTSVERQMRETAHRQLETADFVLLVHDSSSGEPALDLPRIPDVVVLTKIDLPNNRTSIEHSMLDIAPPMGFVNVSCHSGANMTGLRQLLNTLTFGDRAGGGLLALNARHLAGIRDAREALSHAMSLLSKGDELVALELRQALDALGEIVGRVTPDDLLGKIFSAFCIGK